MVAPSSYLSQGVRDFRERGAARREEAAEESHHEREDDARHEQCRREAEGEYDLRERREVRRARDAGERELDGERAEQAPEDSPEEREAQRLEDERQEHRDSRETECAQRRDLARARGHGGVHCVHRSEAGANRHDDSHEEAQELDRRGRGRLVVVILALDLAFESEPRIAREACLELVERKYYDD